MPDGLAYTFTLRDDLRWSTGSTHAQHFAAGLAAVLAPDSTAPGAPPCSDRRGVDVVDAARCASACGATCPTCRPARDATRGHRCIRQPRARPATDAHVNGAYRVLSRRPGEWIELERILTTTARPRSRSAASTTWSSRTSHGIEDVPGRRSRDDERGAELHSSVPAGDAARRTARRSIPERICICREPAAAPDRRVRLALAMALDRDRIRARSLAPVRRPRSAGSGRDSRLCAGRGSSGAVCRTRRRADRRARSGTRHGMPGRRLRSSSSARTRARTTTARGGACRPVANGLASRQRSSSSSAGLSDTRHHPGDCDLVRLGWSADFVDPEAFATVFETGNPQDTARLFRSSAYDGLLEQSRLAADVPRRMALLAARERHCWRTCRWSRSSSVSEAPREAVWCRASAPNPPRHRGLARPQLRPGLKKMGGWRGHRAERTRVRGQCQIRDSRCHRVDDGLEFGRGQDAQGPHAAAVGSNGR